MYYLLIVTSTRLLTPKLWIAASEYRKEAASYYTHPLLTRVRCHSRLQPHWSRKGCLCRVLRRSW